jgi:predicted site-specific integrase-resolvase
MHEKTYSTEAAAEKAGISYVSLRRWLSAGRFQPSVQIEMDGGRHLWRFTDADVKRLRTTVKERRWRWPGMGRPKKSKG